MASPIGRAPTDFQEKNIPIASRRSSAPIARPHSGRWALRTGVADRIHDASNIGYGLVRREVVGRILTRHDQGTLVVMRVGTVLRPACSSHSRIAPSASSVSKSQVFRTGGLFSLLHSITDCIGIEIHNVLGENDRGDRYCEVV